MSHESIAERPCEVRMEDGSWLPGIVIRDELREPRRPGGRRVHAALVGFDGLLLWLFRHQGPGHPNEWREAE